MYVQNMWIGKKKYSLTRIESGESGYDRIMQTYYGKSINKEGKLGKEQEIATIEYHKPIFDRRLIKHKPKHK